MNLCDTLLRYFNMVHLAPSPTSLLLTENCFLYNSIYFAQLVQRQEYRNTVHFCTLVEFFI
jgi:hypothetical protein